jgi:hypothetical protein
MLLRNSFAGYAAALVLSENLQKQWCDCFAE